MTRFTRGTGPGYGEVRVDGVLTRSSLLGGFLACVVEREAEASEEDGGLKRRPGPKRSRERAHAEDLTISSARLRDRLHHAPAPRVKRAKTSG
jgi:hypothetical protein